MNGKKTERMLRFESRLSQNPQTREVVKLYEEFMAELTDSNKAIITDLSRIAKEHMDHAEGIANAICDRILKVQKNQKLDFFHLLDSILKNVCHPYPKYFGARLHEVFVETYKEVGSSLRARFLHLFRTWSSRHFPVSVLDQIKDELDLIKDEDLIPFQDKQKSGLLEDLRHSGSQSSHLSLGVQEYLDAHHQPKYSSLDTPLARSPSTFRPYRQSSFQYGRNDRERIGTSAEGEAEGPLHDSRRGCGGVQSLQTSLAYRDNSGCEKLHARLLIAAYGSLDPVPEKLPKFQRLDCEGTSSQTTMRHIHSTEEEYVWETMSPTLSTKMIGCRHKLTAGVPDTSSARQNTTCPREKFRSDSYSQHFSPSSSDPAKVIAMDDVARYNEITIQHKTSLLAQKPLDLPNVPPNSSCEMSIPISQGEGIQMSNLTSGTKKLTTGKEVYFPSHDVQQKEVHSHAHPLNGEASASIKGIFTKKEETIKGPISSNLLSGSTVPNSYFSLNSSLQSSLHQFSRPLPPAGALPLVHPASVHHLPVPLSAAVPPSHPPFSPANLHYDAHPPAAPLQYPSHLQGPHPLPPTDPLPVVHPASFHRLPAPLSAAVPPSHPPFPPANLHYVAHLPAAPLQYPSHPQRPRPHCPTDPLPLVHPAPPLSTAAPPLHPSLPTNCHYRAHPPAAPSQYLSHPLLRPPASFNSDKSHRISIPQSTLVTQFTNLTSTNTSSSDCAPPLPPGPPPASIQVNSGFENSGTGISESSATYSGLSTSFTPQGLPSFNTPITSQDVERHFNPKFLKFRHESSINDLYGKLPRQCTTCGMRFKCQEEHSSHMDWHVTKNRQAKNRMIKPSRKWYVSAKDWRSCAEALGTDVFPEFLRSELVVKKKEERKVVPVDEKQPLCALCQEPFEDDYSDEMEEWVYKDAVYLNASRKVFGGAKRFELGDIVHTKCL